MRIITNQRTICLLVAALILVWCTAVPAIAKKPGVPMNPEGQLLIQLPIVKATIAKKSLQKVTTSLGDAYALFEETIIVGMDGKQLSIRELPVPCDAELIYTAEKGVRKALRIGITSISDDATTQWTSEAPD